MTKQEILEKARRILKEKREKKIAILFSICRAAGICPECGGEDFTTLPEELRGKLYIGHILCKNCCHKIVKYVRLEEESKPDYKGYEGWGYKI